MKKRQIAEKKFCHMEIEIFFYPKIEESSFSFYEGLMRNLMQSRKRRIQFGIAFRIGSTVHWTRRHLMPGSMEKGPIVSRVRSLPVLYAHRSKSIMQYSRSAAALRGARWCLRMTQGHPITPSCGSITSLIVRFSVRRYEMLARTSFCPTTSCGWSCKSSPTTSTGACRKRPTTTRSSSASPPTCKICRTAPVNEKAWQFIYGRKLIKQHFNFVLIESREKFEVKYIEFTHKK